MKSIEKKIIYSYILGFLLSVFLTLTAYNSVVLHMNSHHEVLSREILVPLLLLFAVMQLIVQLRFFLHLGWGSDTRLNLIFFISTGLIIVLVVLASLWIMGNLNYNMMPEHVEQYIIEEEGIYRAH